MSQSKPCSAPAQVRDFSKSQGFYEVPDLAGLQKKSFASFTQLSSDGERADQGLAALLREACVRLQQHGLHYQDYAIEPPALSPQACERQGRTYAGLLRLQLRQDDALVICDMGPLPLMTERGTFIICGTEKVVVGQLRALADDEVCDLATRRLELVGQQLAAALIKPLATDLESLTAAPAEFPHFRAALQRFFDKTPLARTTNPLTLISHVRQVVQRSAKGPLGYAARCPHLSHFGRLCLLETPEGERIGVNLSAAVYAAVSPDGELLTPYRDRNGKIRSISADDEADKVIADIGADDAYNRRYGGGWLARRAGQIYRATGSRLDCLPVSPSQALGASASLIPLLAHDDANRALMGVNMQKQAVPLASPEAPIVATGIERQLAVDSGAVVLADAAGTITAIEADAIVVQTADGDNRAHPVRLLADEASGMQFGHRPVVAVGQEVTVGQLLADGPATDNGVLALGRNILVGYLSWYGYNFEDGMVISDRLIRDGVFTSVWTRSFTARLDDSDQVIGEIVAVGTTVTGGDVLIAKTRIASQRDVSVRLPHGQSGTVVEVVRTTDGPGELVRVVVAAKRELRIGDKLSNRHGAKGVVTRILPEAEMPVLPDGRRLELMISPLGVPSRMNIGAILEAHLGLAAHQLGCTVISPGFNGVNGDEISALLSEAGFPASGMLSLQDGLTGHPFDQPTTVGYIYMMKLDHMVADKCQARATGDYDAATAQPVGGRGRQGGQRLGIMETWALEAHGAAAVLQEALTIKSDAVCARDQTCAALVAGKALPPPTVPASLSQLALKLRGLCLDLLAFGDDDRPLDLQNPETPVDQIKNAALSFADAQTVSEWSAGSDCIELVVPVQHRWQTHTARAIPQITVLPVLSETLCGGSQLTPAYQAVREANERCRSQSTEQHQAALQAAVDELLERLTRQLYGKRGWITEAISGKTVDYAGRSVICAGPQLDYDTCSIPLAMAAVLLEPIVTGVLLRNGLAAAADEATAMLRDRVPAAMSVLNQEAGKRFVLLHRAPVLHRMGIQAFRMGLTDEDVIRLHPLTMVAFNADLDGDEMDVFLPLSDAAQAEARELMRASQCQLGPANGVFLGSPMQDMVLGCYYATCRAATGNATLAFDSVAAVDTAFAAHEVGIHDAITVADHRTTVGRALFNALLPSELGPLEEPVTRAVLRDLCTRCWRELGADAAARLGDALMRFGFKHATLSGMSLGKDLVPRFSGLDRELAAAWQQADALAAEGADHEQKQLDLWLQTTERVCSDALTELAADRDGLNTVHAMYTSGARGSRNQLRQLIALRGLMAMPEGQIIAAPITTNFLTGHSPFEYLAGTFGARKGLVDTSLKTADAGYLFKRVMNAVQDELLAELDCGATSGLVKPADAAAIAGRTALKDIVAADGEIIVAGGEIIGPAAALTLAASGLSEIVVRSPVTCRSSGGVCAKCYGLDLATNAMPRSGLAIGVIAAQSIGEPCTQLTMRTFHCGHVSRSGATKEAKREDIVGGLPRLDELLEAWSRKGQDSPELAELSELCTRAGVAAAAGHLLREMQNVYRTQGVRIDDKHFEVVLRRMFATGALRGISAAAVDTDDFIVAGSCYGGIPVLAEIAARGQRLPLTAIRNSVAFGKQIPAPA